MQSEETKRFKREDGKDAVAALSSDDHPGAAQKHIDRPRVKGAYHRQSSGKCRAGLKLNSRAGNGPPTETGLRVRSQPRRKLKRFVQKIPKRKQRIQPENNSSGTRYPYLR